MARQMVRLVKEVIGRRSCWPLASGGGTYNTHEAREPPNTLYREKRMKNGGEVKFNYA